MKYRRPVRALLGLMALISKRWVWIAAALFTLLFIIPVSTHVIVAMLPTPTATPTITQTYTPVPTRTPYIVVVPTFIPTATLTPTVTQTPTPTHPPGMTGRCADGTFTSSHQKLGACSNHGGVAAWWGP